MNNACPKCGRLYQVEREHIGRRVLCKQCGTRLIVTEAGLSLLPAAPNPPLPAPPVPVAGHSPVGGIPSGANVYNYPTPSAPSPPSPPSVFDLDQDDDR